MFLIFVGILIHLLKIWMLIVNTSVFLGRVEFRGLPPVSAGSAKTPSRPFKPESRTAPQKRRRQKPRVNITKEPGRGSSTTEEAASKPQDVTAMVHLFQVNTHDHRKPNLVKPCCGSVVYVM